MAIPRKSLAFLFLAFFTANAQLLNPINTAEQEKGYIASSALDNSRVSIYLHPFNLISGASMKLLLLYSTIEVPLNLYFAPIIKPSLWNYRDRLFRLGSDFGLRHYLAGRGEGWYLQPQVGLFYLSAKVEDWSFDLDDLDDDSNRGSTSKGTWFDGMLYLGSSYKFAYVNIYYDFGMGYGCALKECVLIYDTNIGIGISF
jgi:hypothetical protein